VIILRRTPFQTYTLAISRKKIARDTITFGGLSADSVNAEGKNDEYYQELYGKVYRGELHRSRYRARGTREEGDA